MQCEFQHEFFQDLPGCLCQGGTLRCAEVKGVKSGITLQGDMLCGCMEDIALCMKASSLIKLSLGEVKKTASKRSVPQADPSDLQCFSKIRKGSLFDIISFPAKTALTSIMYASYAALIYLTVCVNAVLEKVKKIFQEEESIRQNREESKHLRKSFSEPALSEPMFPDGEIKVKSYCSLLDQPDNISYFPDNMLSNKIQVLHSVFDQSTEINE
ncbi:PREDICTED: spermatogenesis-associated protein 9 isoform X3 [Myotis davidii]|uniref:spermatogenesis-associated protein 9 isoform X3 n=1 Tax=Myotis davidii TaxID=225400 RepID=UPI000767C710|nr:PREDICTED: spermatogenesis-associated protein 9 isoform X3 [Myotis davidii]